MTFRNSTQILKAMATAASLLVAAAPAAAVTLATPIDTNNGQRGIMFDVVVGASDLTLTSLASVIYENTTADYEFYTITGGITGNTNSSTGWTLRDSFASVSGASTRNVFTAFDISDFTLLANTTYGFYFTNTSGGGVAYTEAPAVGAIRASNADLSILTGVGKAYAFGTNFTSRAFSGSLTYTIGTVSSVVPEPASWAMLIAGFGLVGGAMRRRRESAALAA